MMHPDVGTRLDAEAQERAVTEAACHSDKDDTAQHCQVKGCTSTLQYEPLKNQRLRICYYHEKARTVDIDGNASRFCQQCCKFHALEKFDGANRGCRKRLQKHNERRKQKTVVKKLGKKLQKVVGSFLCAKAQLEAQHPLDVGESSGTGSCPPLRKTDTLTSIIQAHVRGLKNPELAALTLPTCEHPVKEEFNGGSNLCTGETDWHYTGHTRHPDHQWSRNTCNDRLGAGTPMGRLGNPLHASSATNCPWGTSTTRVEEASPRAERAGARRTSPASGLGASNEGSNEMEEDQFANRRHGGPPNADACNVPTGYRSGGSEESQCYNMRQTDAQQCDQATNMGWGGQSRASGRCNLNLNEVSADEVMEMAWNQGWNSSQFYGAGFEGSMGQTGWANKTCFDPYESRTFGVTNNCCGNHFTSSMKIAGITPGALPDNLREEIVSWLQVDPREITGSIRPGCVHLTLDMWFHSLADCAQAQMNMPEGFAKSVSSNGIHPWCSHKTVLRLPHCLLIADNGELLCEESVQEQSLALEAQSTVVTPGAEVHLLAWSNELAPALLCRSGGKYIELDNETWTREPDGRVLISAVIPVEAACGLVWFELCDTRASGLVVSDSVAVVIRDISPYSSAVPVSGWDSLRHSCTDDASDNSSWSSASVSYQCDTATAEEAALFQTWMYRLLEAFIDVTREILLAPALKCTEIAYTSTRMLHHLTLSVICNS